MARFIIICCFLILKAILSASLQCWGTSTDVCVYFQNASVRTLLEIDGFVNLNISLNSIASFGNLAPSALALLFCFSLIKRSLSIVTTWSLQYTVYTHLRSRSIWQ